MRQVFADMKSQSGDESRNVVDIKLIDFAHWSVREYIEQVLLIEPVAKGGVPVQFVHFPQSTELLVLNIGYNPSQSDVSFIPAAHYHFFCGKNDRNSVYRTHLVEPLCIVQFKPHAWYAFAKNGVEKYRNKVLRLSCGVGECLDSFIEKTLPHYLEGYLKPSKIKEPPYTQMPLVLRYIDDHINTVTVAGLSRAFQLSEATLRRYFKKYIGMNVSAYIRSQKVKLMTVRMYQDDYNAVSVQECGFYDQSHFIREFKRIHATTPTHFMRQLKGHFMENRHSEALFQACYVSV